MRFNFRMEVLDVACEVKLCVHSIGVSNRISKLHEFWILACLHLDTLLKEISLTFLFLALSILNVRSGSSNISVSKQRLLYEVLNALNGCYLFFFRQLRLNVVQYIRYYDGSNICFYLLTCFLNCVNYFRSVIVNDFTVSFLNLSYQ